MPALCLLIYALALTLGLFNGGADAAIGIAGALLLWVQACVSRRDLLLPDRRLGLLLAGLLAAIMLLDCQAEYPGISWHATLELGSVLVPLSLLSCPAPQAAANPSVLFKSLPWIAVAGLLALGLELGLGEPLMRALRGEAMPTKYNRGLSHAMLLLWPLLAALWADRQRWTLLALAAAALVPLALTDSRATQLAMMLAAGVCALGWVLPRVTAALLMLLALLAAGWPFAAHFIFTHDPDWVAHLPPSWHARVEIWDYVSFYVRQRPWLGWGLGSSYKLDPALTPDFAGYTFVGIGKAHASAAHPHNVMMQLWAELGLAGVLMGLAAVALVLRRITRMARGVRPFALAAFATAFGLSLVAYDFWTDAFLASFALTAFLFGLQGGRLRPINLSLNTPPDDRKLAEPVLI